MIRKHLREEHMVRGLRKDSVGKKLDSQLTANTIVKEIEWNNKQKNSNMKK